MDQPQVPGVISCCRIVYKTMLLQETADEVVVPDSMPDIEQILDAQCSLYIRSRSLENGCITLEGTVRGTVLYSGEGEEFPCRMELELPLTVTVQEDALKEAQSMTVETALRGWEAKAINSRKLRLRAEAAAAVTLFGTETLDLSTQCNDPDALERRTETAEIGYIAAVTEKSFVVSDDLTLSGGAPPIDRILLSRWDARIRETKPVASKMLLQGEAALELIYTAPGESQLQQASFTLPFSQIMDMPEDMFSVSSVALLPSSAFIEPLPGFNGANSIGVELHLTAQAVCTARREISYVADAYCLRHPSQIERQKYDALTPFSAEELSQTLSDTAELPEKGSEVCYYLANASLPVVTESAVRVEVTFRALIKGESGIFCPVTRRLQAEWRRENDTAAKLYTCPRVWDTAAVLHGDKLELRCAVTLFRLYAGAMTLEHVRSAEVDAETRQELYEGPSAVVVRPGGRTLWELAKRYGSTVALIGEFNASPEGAPLLLIPRAR